MVINWAANFQIARQQVSVFACHHGEADSQLTRLGQQVIFKQVAAIGLHRCHAFDVADFNVNRCVFDWLVGGVPVQKNCHFARGNNAHQFK